MDKKDTSANAYVPPEVDPPVGETVQTTEAEWKTKLSGEQFHVLRENGTERAFTGALWNHKGDGVYRCGGCGAPLFDSKTKYDSGSGWPSFYAAIDPQRVTEKTDHTLGMRRVEIECARCGGHLGHVFPDGPPPTGQRYCVNSASLHFDDRESPEK